MFILFTITEYPQAFLLIDILYISRQDPNYLRLIESIRLDSGRFQEQRGTGNESRQSLQYSTSSNNY